MARVCFLETMLFCPRLTVHRAFISEPGVVLFRCLSCTTLA
ncbi:rCG20438 [Rattus norvegicus]|uniref:RCG20438 n=1 Tax=Rattus norvegicus TaxID=10116 RepID=A6JGZ1_RAT|nr:rCG20438 [Rattus norvegicus]